MLKRIVLCADGTWNTPHGPAATAHDTNVRKMYCALTEGEDQVRFYDSGVGTSGQPIDHLMGGAMGEGLFEKIQENYQYLADRWSPGDQIYLFGFSRGAYTVRSLGGMIAGFGVPTRNFDNQTVQRIFAAYRTTDPGRRKALKSELTSEYGLTDVTVRLIGVWDTVGALGIPGFLFSLFNERQYGFLDTALHPCVERACHAVSLDERRGQFQPTLWTMPDGSPRRNDAQVKQVWFAGVHSDVGGGYEDSSLADITMAWMMRQAMECGLVFSDEAMARYGALDLACARGAAHDEWKMVPWGMPHTRKLPPTAVISDSVQARLSGLATYSPGNLALTGRMLSGYTVEPVMGQGREAGSGGVVATPTAESAQP